jgi:hypothetical protein
MMRSILSLGTPELMMIFAVLAFFLFSYLVFKGILIIISKIKE